MSIITASQGDAPEFIELVEITWPSGVVRMLKGPGIVTALSQTWESISDTWGQILSLGARSQKAGEIANRDLVLTTTASVRTQLWYGATRWSQVRIWEASRNPITGTLDVATDPWIGFIDDASADDGIDSAVTLTLVSSAVILREPDAGALTSTTSQNRFVTGDTAFDFISGPVRDPFSLQGFDPAGGYNSGPGFDGGGFSNGGINGFDNFRFS
jgi:hypothetical protein